MEKVLYDFIQELLAGDGIAMHHVVLPNEDWNRIDSGLRDKLFGITDLSVQMNQLFEIIERNTLYHYVDLFQCNYTVFRLPDGENGIAAPQFLVAGPVLFEQIQGERFEELFLQLELPPLVMESLRCYYQNIPFVSFQSHYENMMIVAANYIFGRGHYQISFRSEEDLENLRHHYQGISRLSDQPFSNVQYIEERYRAESELLTAVSHGNEAQAVKSVRKLTDIGIPPRLPSRLRDKKDLTITLNSLMRKAAEHAGVHPIHIDSFSNQSIQQLEQLGSLEQCTAFQRRLALGYCRLVKKYSLTGYSLPIQRVVTYVTTDFGADLSLKALAGRLNVTPSYLSSLFRKEVGVTLTDYVNQQRITHAQYLLLNTSLPTKSIAQQCGIADLNYFSRIFKRITGATPKAYRDTAAHSQQLEIRRNHRKEIADNPLKKVSR